MNLKLYAAISPVQIPIHTLNLFKQDIRTHTNQHRLWNNIRANPTSNALYDEMNIINVVIHHSTPPTYYPSQARNVLPSAIDSVITNNLNNISPIYTRNELTSDHLPIEFEIEKPLQSLATTYINYINQNIEINPATLNNSDDTCTYNTSHKQY